MKVVLTQLFVPIFKLQRMQDATLNLQHSPPDLFNDTAFNVGGQYQPIPPDLTFYAPSFPQEQVPLQDLYGQNDGDSYSSSTRQSSISLSSVNGSTIYSSRVQNSVVNVDETGRMLNVTVAKLVHPNLSRPKSSWPASSKTTLVQATLVQDQGCPGQGWAGPRLSKPRSSMTQVDQVISSTCNSTKFINLRAPRSSKSMMNEYRIELVPLTACRDFHENFVNIVWIVEYVFPSFWNWNFGGATGDRNSQKKLRVWTRPMHSLLVGVA